MRAAVLALALSTAAAAQPLDSLAAAPPASERASERTSRGAVTRALLLPGLGQVYNRQPLKAPVAVGAVAGAVAFAVFRQRRYVIYRRAALYGGCLVDDGVPDTPDDLQDNGRIRLCSEVAPGYEDEFVRVGQTDVRTLQSTRDRFRGERDIGVLVVALVYGAQALDAYVAAELDSFDVSEDLSLRLDAPGGSPGLALRWRID